MVWKNKPFKNDNKIYKGSKNLKFNKFIIISVHLIKK